MFWLFGRGLFDLGFRFVEKVGENPEKAKKGFLDRLDYGNLGTKVNILRYEKKGV